MPRHGFENWISHLFLLRKSIPNTELLISATSILWTYLSPPNSSDTSHSPKNGFLSLEAVTILRLTGTTDTLSPKVFTNSSLKTEYVAPESIKSGIGFFCTLASMNNPSFALSSTPVIPMKTVFWIGSTSSAEMRAIFSNLGCLPFPWFSEVVLFTFWGKLSPICLSKPPFLTLFLEFLSW